MAAAIRTGAAAPIGPPTDGAGGRGATRDYAHPADASGQPPAAPSASHAATTPVPPPAPVTPRAERPGSACAASSRQSAARPDAAGARRWRRNARLPRAAAPCARSDTSEGAREGCAWIARLPWVRQPGARAARAAPTHAPPNLTARLCRSPSTPWSNWRAATRSGASRPKPRSPPASSSPGCGATRWKCGPMCPSSRFARSDRPHPARQPPAGGGCRRPPGPSAVYGRRGRPGGRGAICGHIALTQDLTIHECTIY